MINPSIHNYIIDGLVGGSGVFRNWIRGRTYKRGLRNGSPPAGLEAELLWGLWSKTPEVERFLEFKLNLVHVIQKDKLKLGLFLKLKLHR